MEQSSEISTTIIDNLIMAKDFRANVIKRFQSRSKIEPLGLRQSLLNKMSTLNRKAPIAKSLIIPELDQDDFPNHLALVPDGNRRYSDKYGKNVGWGYAAGARKIKQFRKWALVDNPINTVSAFLLSTENIERRPEDELEQLFQVFADFFDEIPESDIVKNNGIRHRVVGNQDSMDKLPQHVRDSIEYMEKQTAEYDGKEMIFMIPHGGRDEIVRAASNTDSGLDSKQITVSNNGEDNNEFRKELDLGGVSDIDLFIRTSEHRISNFALYHLAYSEIVFVDSLWPEFSEHDFLQAIYQYANTSRRFGV
jgi:undecaprenyl diphosphate synthase